MKRAHFTLAIASGALAGALALGTIASTPVANAQEPGSAITATIPFDFQAGSDRLPAGKYQIDRLGDHVLVLREWSKHATEAIAVYSASTSTASEDGKVVFHRYGDKYFLYQIWTPGSSVGNQCSTSKAEKEINMAVNRPEPTTVELALNAQPQH